MTDEIELLELEFTAADFHNSESSVWAGEIGTTFVSEESAAEIANKLLREKLAKAQQLQMRRVGKMIMPICMHESLYSANTDAYGKAYLVCYTEIPK